MQQTGSEVEAPTFRVTIRHPNGIALVTTSTATTEALVGDLPVGIAHLDLVIDRMPLLPGDYSLSFEIRDRSQTHVYDSWDHAEILRVQPGSSPERDGLVDIAPRWEVGTA